MRSWSVAAVLAPCLVWSLGGAPEVEFGAPKVDTDMGQIEGKTDKSLTKKNVDKFLGIPFAAPPVGDLRFRPPQPFNDSWAPKTRKAKSYGHVCPQLDIASLLELGKEDCLYLNVYRPAGTKAGDNLPVFVWIYGGGYFIGDGHEFGLYDGTTLVQKHEYVIVTMNYRLSGHGFMALPELQDEDPDGTVGNYGVQDQRAALQWVQRNIKNFGGDPDRVTLAGESAGAFSVTYHTVAPASRGLFHAAIMESGTSHNNMFFQNKSQAFEFYSEWATILGCPKQENGADRLQCLRSLKQRDLVISFAQMAKDIIGRITGLLPGDIPDFASPLWPLMPFGPVIDGTDVGLPDVPYTLMQKGDFAKVPLIIGANKDGGGYFGIALPLLWGGLKSDFKKTTEWFLPDQSDRDRAMDIYGDSSFPSDRQRMNRFMRDVTFDCSNRDVANIWASQGVPVYLYQFSFDFTGWVQNKIGDAHAFELPFVWDNWDKIFGTLSIQGSRKSYQHMADIMSCTWASFINCQAPKCDSDPPNCKSLKDVPAWPQYDADNRYYISLNAHSTIESVQSATPIYQSDEFPGDDRCDFFQTANLDWQPIRKSATTMWLNSSRMYMASQPQEVVV